MLLELLSLNKSLNPAYRKQSLKRDQIDVFKANLSKMFSRINEAESEENQKNIVSDFLKDTYYKHTNEINTKGRKDLVIHNDKTAGSTVGVIIEVKRPSNKSEMISKEKPNAKALHELLHYYLHERFIKNNKEIKHLIITNIYEWFIFDGAEFERFFFEHPQLTKDYKRWNDKLYGLETTEWFYKEVAQPFIEKELDKLTCSYFDLHLFESILAENNHQDEQKLLDLYKILSPEHLLKKPFANDSNTLNKNFYNELLHIIGLEESKEAGKKIIKRKKERDRGSLLENTICECETAIRDSSDSFTPSEGRTKDEEIFSIALELCITWLNRILFLKLLEGQLIKYHKGVKKYAFLNDSTITTFRELNDLFFEVLARKTSERDSSILSAFENIPYLNSSLFDVTEYEKDFIKIKDLRDTLDIPVDSHTVLKSATGTRISGNKNTLHYLFEFLDAYDFASDSAAEIQEQNKTIINASVLGLIFEKINGYKDGSFFTPGFITMYMCRETIRRAVTEKFNERFGWTCANFTDLFNKLGTISLTDANATVNSLKICDPAVGSGHFLVSALNEIIAIKSELQILTDREGKLLRGYKIVIENDELIVTFDEEIISYNYKNHESQRVQETLFHEKQTIIENCLFGVDINPKSVMICRLRLWIELLKNAYYRPDSNFTELETLPNIDINIKCGNSLLSRFALDADLSKALKSIKYDINAYRGFVQDYKNATNRELKRGLMDIINNIKNDFRVEILSNDPKILRHSKLSGELLTLLTQTSAFDPTEKEKKEQKAKQVKLEAEIAKLAREIEDIKSNALYKNAFEWRFEFPEVLNDNGDFVGFDVVIGNPPYINAIELKKSLHETIYNKLKFDYQTAKGAIDLFIYFFEMGLKLIKKNAILSFITPNRYLSASYGEALRELLFHQTQIIEIIDYSHVNVFKEASTYPIVTTLRKTDITESIYPISIGKYDDHLLKLNFKNITSEKLNLVEGYIWGFLLNDKITVTEKIINQSVSITKSALINATSTASEADDYHILINESKGIKLINTGTIDRYESLWGKYPLTDKGKTFLTPYLTNTANKISKNRISLYNSQKIILAKIAIRAEAFYDGKGEYASINTNCFHSFKSGFDAKYVLSWLNSKLFQFTFECFFDGLKMQGGYLLYSSPNVAKMFIKEIDLKAQQPFIKTVDKILKAKQAGKDTTALEQEIDRMVYALYGLTEEEIAVVEGR